ARVRSRAPRALLRRVDAAPTEWRGRRRGERSPAAGSGRAVAPRRRKSRRRPHARRLRPAARWSSRPGSKGTAPRTVGKSEASGIRLCALKAWSLLGSLTQIQPHGPRGGGLFGGSRTRRFSKRTAQGRRSQRCPPDEDTGAVQASDVRRFARARKLKCEL